jgi:hypothetical protein
MLAEVFFYLFIIICLVICGWGMLRLTRIYQFPVFMAAIFLSFVAPQGYALIEEAKSYGFLATDRLSNVFFYACLCISMCWLGYQKYHPSQKWLSKLDIEFDENKLFRAGFFLLAIGFLCQFLFTKITPEIAENGNWTGPATILWFFLGVIYNAFPIFLIAALRRPSPVKISMAIVSAIPILQLIFQHGRRQPLMTFFLSIGMSFFLIKKYVPPRWIFLVFVPAAIVAIPLLGQLRGNFWGLLFSGDLQTAIDTSQTELSKLQKLNILELRNAAVMIEAADLTNRFGWGTGLWNDLVFQYVPGQIVGFGVKKSLQIAARPDLYQLFGYKVHPGTTWTGLGDSYAEFGYLGCLLFGAIGRIFKTLWVSIYHSSMFSALLYIGLISPAMVAITHGIGRFLQEFTFQVGVMYLVSRYAKVGSRYRQIEMPR